MNRTILEVLGIGALLALLVGSGFTNNRTDDPLGVAVSPQTLILGASQGGSVKVHTAIPVGSVDRASVTLNGLPAAGIGVDSLGNMVGIFSEDAVKAMVEPPSAVLTLEGLYKDGSPFAGSDTVRVTESCFAQASVAIRVIEDVS